MERQLGMTQEQSRFIRQLKITLIGVLGPFMIGVVVAVVNDHYKIKNNIEHMKVLEDTRVSKDLMMLYYNQLRELNEAVQDDIDAHTADTKHQVEMINARLDALMKEMYSQKKRAPTDPMDLGMVDVE